MTGSVWTQRLHIICAGMAFLVAPLWAADEPRRYDGYQIVRVEVSAAEIEAIEGTGA